MGYIPSSLLLLSFPPIIIVIPLSWSTQYDLAWFWWSSMLCSRLYCHMLLVCPHWVLCFCPKFPTLDILTNNDHHRSLLVRIRIQSPFLCTPHHPQPQWGQPPSPHYHQGAQHT
jgi:hypothetical protein